MKFNPTREHREVGCFANLSTWAPDPQYHGDETSTLFDIPEGDAP